MGYCTVEDLESYFLGTTFKCGDYLTSNKADELIECDRVIINSYIKSRYSLPITDTDDLILLKSINVKMVVGTIDDIFREKTENGQFSRGRDTRKEALAILKQIKDGDVILNGTSKKSVIKFNNVDSNGQEVEKRFKDSNIEPVVFTTNKEHGTTSIGSY